ncbi:hypothetical protein KPH14_009187 [Odynerus spinipes]|uniref:Uncharacterized protein n=1 Tax=Odynerus spinipes TaxID=1348599 RepID=A0AAD9RPA5_9HYME|nr:hypothetical protein KPH14_009187 [Odynerus spinipes]
MASAINSESKESTISTSTAMVIETQTDNSKYLSSSYGRANSAFRRGSNSFNAVIHHKRGLLGYIDDS